MRSACPTAEEIIDEAYLAIYPKRKMTISGVLELVFGSSSLGVEPLRLC